MCDTATGQVWTAIVTAYRCQGCGQSFSTMQDHYCGTTPSSTEVKEKGDT